jgi:undecaprenyl-diphosphatase
MDPLHAVLVAVIQGATELFPVSSLGHAVVLPVLLGWRLDQQGPDFLPFLVLLHVGTLAALLAYFWRDWWALLVGVLGFGSAHEVGESRRVFLLIVVATLPAVVLGGLLEHFLRRLFGSPVIAAGFLVANGVMLIVGERLRSMGHRPLSTLRVPDALAIGIWQCLALLPGLSRSGATMVGALLRGIDHEEAAHFSFLIAAPIILAATALEVPKLLRAGIAPGTLPTAVLAAGVAGVVALLSTWFLMRWFRRHDDWALTPFGWYCIAFGAAAAAYLEFA